MNIDQQIIDLATRIQRRHDFSSHVTGFLCGAAILGALLIGGIKAGALYPAAVLTWATVLSFQHFRQVLRGPVTADAVRAEAVRLGRSRPDGEREQPAARINR
jgi:hypothetical protein